MNDHLKKLEDIFGLVNAAALAVSGGVDSMLLAVVALNGGRKNFEVFHAVSPAVQRDGTKRVKKFAKQFQWPLRIIEVGEFQDENYLRNPVNRCFYCKHNLYKVFRTLTQATIFSGTNHDDLQDFRPGLRAAEEHGVRHPFVEAGITKDVIRQLANYRGFKELADLPAQPCLSSRVMTGTRISSEVLDSIYAVEVWVRENLEPRVVRCRFSKKSICIELDATAFKSLSEEQRLAIMRIVAHSFRFMSPVPEISFSLYRMGSAVTIPGRV